MSLLTPEPGLVFWMTLSFLIVLFILAKFAFPVILKAVDERKNYIENSLLAAQKANEELAKITETRETILAETRVKQAEILKEGAKIKEEIIAKAKDDAQLESEKIIQSARNQISAEKEKAIRMIRNEAALLSVELAEKMLREKLTTPEEQSKMINRLLDEIEISKS